MENARDDAGVFITHFSFSTLEGADSVENVQLPLFSNDGSPHSHPQKISGATCRIPLRPFVVQ